MGQFFDLDTEANKHLKQWLWDDGVFIKRLSDSYALYAHDIESLKLNYPCNINLFPFNSSNNKLKKSDFFKWILSETKGFCLVKQEHCGIVMRVGSVPSWNDETGFYAFDSSRIYFSEPEDFMHFKLKFELEEFNLKNMVDREITQLPYMNPVDFNTSDNNGFMKRGWTIGPRHPTVGDILRREYIEEFDSSWIGIEYPKNMKN